MNKIVSSNAVQLDDAKMSTVYIGNIVEVVTSNRTPNNLSKFKKLNKFQYVDCRTGEIKQYKHNTNRSNSFNTVKKSLTNLRRIINYNFIGDSSEKFLTLTYSTLMTDTNKLYRDYQNFIVALRKHYTVEYICIVEPQTSGSLHCHVLLKSFVEKKLFIPIALINRLWKHGYAFIKRISSIEKFGFYFSIKLSNSYDNCEYADKTNIPKSVIKGERLHYYKTGFKIYRCSRGIKRPSAMRMSYGEAKKLTADMRCCYSGSKKIISVDKQGNEKVLNVVNYEQYKRIKEENKHANNQNINKKVDNLS